MLTSPKLASMRFQPVSTPTAVGYERDGKAAGVLHLLFHYLLYPTLLFHDILIFYILYQVSFYSLSRNPHKRATHSVELYCHDAVYAWQGEAMLCGVGG